MKHYKAHWGVLLVMLSVLQAALCLGAALYSFVNGQRWVSILLMALTCGCLLFSIQGYTLTPSSILVHRPLWSTRLPLAGLRSARLRPGRTSCLGIRIGNGGFFSFTGWWYTRAGFYRVFVTDPHDAVVLEFPKRKVVVSPRPPDEFVRDIDAFTHAAARGAF